jgi:hypothetical protein
MGISAAFHFRYRRRILSSLRGVRTHRRGRNGDQNHGIADNAAALFFANLHGTGYALTLTGWLILRSVPRRRLPPHRPCDHAESQVGPARAGTTAVRESGPDACLNHSRNTAIELDIAVTAYRAYRYYAPKSLRMPSTERSSSTKGQCSPYPAGLITIDSRATRGAFASRSESSLHSAETTIPSIRSVNRSSLTDSIVTRCFVSIIRLHSLSIVPRFYEFIEMVQQRPSYKPEICRGYVMGECRRYVIPFLIQPELSLGFSFHNVDMRRFVSLVGIEKETPAFEEQYCRHKYLLLIYYRRIDVVFNVFGLSRAFVVREPFAKRFDSFFLSAETGSPPDCGSMFRLNHQRPVTSLYHFRPPGAYLRYAASQGR